MRRKKSEESLARANIDLDQRLAAKAGAILKFMWWPIDTAPFDCDLHLAVIDSGGEHALVFPCRRVLSGWINAETKSKIDVQPTHWREWNKDA